MSSVPDTHNYTASCFMSIVSEKIFGDRDVGNSRKESSYECFVNQPERISIKITDPIYSIYNDNIEAYYRDAELLGPIELKTQSLWQPNDKSKRVTHAITSIKNEMPIPEKGGVGSYISISAIDIPHYLLYAGDAYGGHYDGKISDVIEKVVNRYSRGKISPIMDVNTSDFSDGIWYQMRMTPIEFIRSLIALSSSITSENTRWLIYPDTEDGYTIKFTEQGLVRSKKRRIYEITRNTGQVKEWYFTCSNTFSVGHSKLISAGISAMNGKYIDSKTNENASVVDDSSISNKKITNLKPGKSFTKAVSSDVINLPVGSSYIESIPELSTGEIGVLYDQYMNGYASGIYQMNQSLLMFGRVTVIGDPEWYGSDGLGVDTIDLIVSTNKGMPYNVSGSWIVYGYRHEMTGSDWQTSLFVYRWYVNGDGKKI